jgi:Bacterial membrane protein YfhO
MSCFPKPDRRDLLAVAAFLIITLGFFARFLTGAQVIAFKDLSRYFYPLRYLMVAQVKAGHLPLWDPYIFCGFPLLATLQIGFFYPLTLIYYILPFNLAFNYYIILHYFLANCFMYALLRHFRLGRRAAFFGGLLFAFSGYLLSVSNMNTSLSSVIWLPLVLLFFDKLINSSFVIRHSSFAWLAVLLALMFLGGEPTIFYVTFWFLLCYALVFAGEKLKSLVALSGAFALALGLIAVQLLPFAELSRLSDRLVLTGFGVVSARSFPPQELLTFIFPYFFGNAAVFGGYTAVLLGKTYQDWLISPYLGVLPLVFILFAGRKKLAFFLWGAVLCSLLLSFGYYTPLYKLIYLIVPGVSLIRYPVKYLFLTSFCLVWLSALGFERLLGSYEAGEERYKNHLRVLEPLIVLASALLLAAYFYAARIIDFFARQYTGIPAVFFVLLSNIIEFNLRSYFNLTAYLIGLFLLLLAARLGRISKHTLAFLLVLAAATDLLANGSSIMVGAPAEVFYYVPPNYAYLARDKSPYRFFYTPGLAAANRAIAGDNYGAALYNAKDNFAADWHVPYQLFDFFGYESIEPFQLAAFYRATFKPETLKANLDNLALFNVKYVFAAEPLNYPELKLLRHKDQYGQNVYVYENQKVLPRAYLLNERNRPDFKIGTVTMTNYRPGFIELNVKSTRPARLFLSETYYPGWRAEVDGVSAEIRRTAFFFSAIRLAPGEHKVKFVYDPMSLKLGAAISLISIMVLLGLAWKGSRG